MSHRLRLMIFLIAFVPLGCNSTSPTETTTSVESTELAPSYYAIAHYDPEADAATDLATTASRAQAESKRIILISGGDW